VITLPVQLQPVAQGLVASVKEQSIIKRQGRVA